MMKIPFKAIAAAACTALCALSFTACNLAGINTPSDNPGNGTTDNTGKSTLLSSAAKPTYLDYSERTDEYKAFTDKVENFASTFAEYAYKDYGKGDNFAVSPISVYMALSLAAECANGQTRTELLNALGVTYGQLEENFPLLFRSLARESKVDGKVTSTLIPTNSIWVNEGTPVNQSCIDALSNYYYCYSYSADFLNDNANANQAIRHFVKEQTKGLIDKDFELSRETLFTLINTLYLKTIWNDSGDDMSFTAEQYDFRQTDGTTKRTKLLQGYYKSGRVYEAETYSTFFTSTYNGYKIKFILPKDGYGVDDVFTAENIAAANSAVYYTADEETKTAYFTRCFFPEYKCGYDKQINGILRENYGIERFFTDPGLFPGMGCDFSTLSEKECYCSKVVHVTDLTVDKTGIEGAAVTVIGMDEASGMPEPWEHYEYEDFILDKAFGFIITDGYDMTLFSGVVNDL